MRLSITARSAKGLKGREANGILMSAPERETAVRARSSTGPTISIIARGALFYKNKERRIKKAAGSIASGLPGLKLIPIMQHYSAPTRWSWPITSIRYGDFRSLIEACKVADFASPSCLRWKAGLQWSPVPRNCVAPTLTMQELLAAKSGRLISV